MKKLFLLLMLIGAVFTSCKKDESEANDGNDIKSIQYHLVYTYPKVAHDPFSSMCIAKIYMYDLDFIGYGKSETDTFRTCEGIHNIRGNTLDKFNSGEASVENCYDSTYSYIIKGSKYVDEFYVLINGERHKIKF